MSRVASGRTSKRSISSTIVSFFKKDKPGEEGWEVEASTSYSPIASFQADDTEDSRMADLVLYESETDGRPPLLPILPLQRMKILRYKQYLRRQQDNIQGPYLENLPNFSKSPPKPNLTALRSLKRTKPSKNPDYKSVLGKRWSGELEYDLSEYDVVKKPKKASDSKQGATSLESPGLAHAILKKSSLSSKQDARDSLSENQMKLLTGDSLLKGVDEDALRNRSNPNAVGSKGSETPRKMGTMPSLGFDFIKNSENDSADENVRQPQSVENKTSVAAKNTGGKLAFSFGSSQPTGASKPNEPSFGSNTTSNGMERLQPKRRLSNSDASVQGLDEKKQTPAFSFGASKNAGEPTANIAPFSFNGAQSVSKKDTETTSISPSISKDTGNGFTTNPKPAFKFAAPNTEKNETPIAADTATQGAETKKPSFVFGSLGNNKSESSKPISFSFGSTAQSNNKETTKPANDGEEGSKVETDKPVIKKPFTFGGASGTEASDLQNKDKSSFDQGTGTSFSFDKAPSTATNGAKPAFSFGSVGKPSVVAEAPTASNAVDGTNKIPSFSFGNSNKSSDTTESKPSFNFGAGDSVKNTEPKPAFSFGLGTAPPKDSDSNGTDGKRMFSFGTADKTKDDGALNGTTSQTSLSRPSTSMTPAFSFGGSADKKDVVAPSFDTTSALGQKPPLSQLAQSGFQINPSSSKLIPPKAQQKTPFSFDANPTAPKPAFSFGTSPSPAFGAPQPQQASSGMNFNFGSGNQQVQPNAGAFGSASTTGNNSPALGTSTNNPQMNFNFNGGNATAPASASPPPFGNASTPAFPDSNPQSRPFSPSHTVNLNFGGPPSQTPTSIFGAGPSTGPAQVFGTQPQNATPAFGSQPQNAAQIFNGSNTAPVQQVPMQIPPGRKLARMRARRG